MKPNVGPMQVASFDDQSAFRQLLDDFYALRRRMGSRQRGAWEPPTDVYETDADIVIKVSIPGVSLDRLAVKCNGEVITVCGFRSGPDPGSVLTYHQMEIRNGYFERRIVIHTPFDPNGATAQYEDGFLYVFVPKAAKLVRHVLTIRLSASSVAERPGKTHDPE